MTRYSPWAVELDLDGAGVGANVVIGGISQQSIDTGAEVSTEVTAGASSPRFAEMANAQSIGSFTTFDIQKTLQTIGIAGACIAGGAAAGFKIWTLQKESCGDLSSGSVHRYLAIPNGRIVPRQLTWQQGSRASLTCEVLSLFDGTNDPVIIAESEAAPLGTIDDLAGYHVGTTKIAGITLGRITGVDIDFGSAITPEFDDGEIFPKSLHIEKQQPTVRISTMDVSKFSSSGIPLVGKAAAHADTELVFRKRLLGTGSFMSGADHLLMTLAGIATYRETSASGNSPHSGTVNLTSLDDGTNAMIVPTYNYTLP